MPLCQDGENDPIKYYYVPILPNVAKNMGTDQGKH